MQEMLPHLRAECKKLKTVQVSSVVFKKELAANKEDDKIFRNPNNHILVP